MLCDNMTNGMFQRLLVVFGIFVGNVNLPTPVCVAMSHSRCFGDMETFCTYKPGDENKMFVCAAWDPSHCLYSYSDLKLSVSLRIWTSDNESTGITFNMTLEEFKNFVPAYPLQLVEVLQNQRRRLEELKVLDQIAFEKALDDYYKLSESITVLLREVDKELFSMSFDELRAKYPHESKLRFKSWKEISSNLKEHLSKISSGFGYKDTNHDEASFPSHLKFWPLALVLLGGGYLCLRYCSAKTKFVDQGKTGSKVVETRSETFL